MTQYLLAVHGSDEQYAAMDPETVEQMFAETGRFNEKVREAGVWVFAGGLKSVDAATVVDGQGDDAGRHRRPVRSRPRSTSAASGSSTSPDLDAALKWAAEGSKACGGKVEVRPFQDRDRPAVGCDAASDLATREIERIYREEYGRVVASLVRRFGDIDIAEEAAGEALLVGPRAVAESTAYLPTPAAG